MGKGGNEGDYIVVEDPENFPILAMPTFDSAPIDRRHKGASEASYYYEVPRTLRLDGRQLETVVKAINIAQVKVPAHLAEVMPQLHANLYNEIKKVHDHGEVEIKSPRGWAMQFMMVCKGIGDKVIDFSGMPPSERDMICACVEIAAKTSSEMIPETTIHEIGGYDEIREGNFCCCECGAAIKTLDKNVKPSMDPVGFICRICSDDTNSDENEVEEHAEMEVVEGEGLLW